MGLTDAIARFADPYDRQARLYPALLAVSPLTLATLVVFAPHLSLLGSTAAAVAGCGLLYWLAGLARDRGKQLESALFTEWGGKPSIQLLRHRNRVIDKVTKARLHGLLASRLGVSFPSPEEEEHDPDRADELYASASRWLLEQTPARSRHPLLSAENAAYGFRRNMLGMRWIGLAMAAIAAGWIVIDGASFITAEPGAIIDQLRLLPLAHRVALGVCMVLACLWIWGVSATRVNVGAFAYAERLISSCEALGTTGQPSATSANSPSSPSPCTETGELERRQHTAGP
jgi:hypothetical protein